MKVLRINAQEFEIFVNPAAFDILRPKGIKSPLWLVILVKCHDKTFNYQNSCSLFTKWKRDTQILNLVNITI